MVQFLLSDFVHLDVKISYYVFLGHFYDTVFFYLLDRWLRELLFFSGMSLFRVQTLMILPDSNVFTVLNKVVCEINFVL